MHTCKRCNKDLSSRQSLIRHLKKRIPCESINEDISLDDYLNELNLNKQYNCIYCSKSFNHKQGKYRHMSSCSMKDSQCVSMKDYCDLKRRIECLEKNDKPVVINNFGTQINNINLKTFGYENMDYLNKEFLNSCLLMNSIVPLIENIHFDKDHPENHNVKLKSSKQELMETYVDGKWIITDTDDTLNELINKGYRVLNYHSKKHKSDIIETEMDEGEFEDVQSWLEKVYEDNRTRKPIKKQLLLLFLNNKTMLLGKEDI
jgi:hypothetical protein